MKLSWMSMVMAASIVLLAYLGIQSMSPLGDDQPVAQVRQSLINNYLVRTRLMDESFAEVMAVIKENLDEEQHKDPIARETLAVFYAVEGQLDETAAIADTLDTQDYDTRLLRYAWLDGETLPDDWTEHEPKDWIDARITAQIAKRVGDVETELKAQEALVAYMDTVRLAYNVQVPRHFFSLIGLGLLISMFFSDRQWRRLGKDDFFRLKPLYFLPEHMWRFVALLLLSVALVSMILGTLPDVPLWAKSVIASLSYIVLGVLLARRFIFNECDADFFASLDLLNLRFHWFNFFQIFGGFAILVACHYYAEMLAILVKWPLNRMDNESLFREMVGNPAPRFLFGFMACLVAPLFEEIFFRGIVFRVLLRSYRPIVAIFGSAFLFAVLHPFAIWPLILAKGVGLAVIYYRTANLLIVVWTHAIWNVMVLLITFAGLGLT